ncbi:MAG: GntR family transcriptional regulator [Spirochaetaceae bacterium]
MSLSKDQIINELKGEILNLILKPGSVLSEAVLTKRFGISRTPIRDILKQLSADGYIVISPQRATRVSYIDLKSVEQIIYLRSTLEKQILIDLCGKLPQATALKLKELLELQKKVMIEDDYYNKFLIYDDEFHKELFIAADRLFLWDLMLKLNVHYVRYRMLHLLETDKLEILYKEHRDITDVLIEGDTTKIEEFINKHIKDDVKSDYFEQNFSEYIL